MRKKKAFNQNSCNYCIFEMYIINVRGEKNNSSDRIPMEI